MGSSSPTAMLWRASFTCNRSAMRTGAENAQKNRANAASTTDSTTTTSIITAAAGAITISLWSCVGISRGATLSAALLYLMRDHKLTRAQQAGGSLQQLKDVDHCFKKLRDAVTIDAKTH